MIRLLPLITKASLILSWLTVDAASLVASAAAETLVAVARGPPPSLSASVIFASSSPVLPVSVSIGFSSPPPSSDTAMSHWKKNRVLQILGKR